VVTSGPHKENPSDLLTSPTFQTVLDACRSRYDFIVIDSPPVLPVTDPCVIAARADGVLLVARLSGETRHATLRTKDALESVGTPVLGLVVNGVVPGKGYRDYRYGYGKYRYVRHDYDYVYGDPLQEPARNGNGRAST
jgi:Mrp family chromosome partitioning ATPase